MRRKIMQPLWEKGTSIFPLIMEECCWTNTSLGGVESDSGIQVSKASERAVCSVSLASLLISLRIVREYSLHVSLEKTTESLLHFSNPLFYHLFQHTSQGGGLLDTVCRKRDGKTRFGSAYVCAENGGLEIHRMFWNSITPGIQYLCRISEAYSDMLSITSI